MPAIHVKPEERKITGTHDDPTYDDAVRQGAGQLDKLKKDLHPAQFNDYMRDVRANPNNVPGLPPFFPPEKIPPMRGIGSGVSWNELPCGHKQVRKGYDVNKKEFFECRYRHRFNNKREQVQ